MIMRSLAGFFCALRGNYHFMIGSPKMRYLLEKAIMADTKSPMAHINYAFVLLDEGADEGLVAEHIEKTEGLVVKEWQKSDIAIAKTYMLAVNEKFAEAIDFLQNYEPKNAKIYSLIAKLHVQSGDFGYALTNALYALELERGAETLNYLGVAQYFLEDYASAKSSFLQALAISDNLIEANFYLGLINGQEGDEAAARKYFLAAKICDIKYFSIVGIEDIEKRARAYEFR